MSDRLFFVLMASALALIAMVLLFGCTGCAGVFWRDSELADLPMPPQCRCCYVGSWEGDPKGCMAWVCNGAPCPEKAP